MHENPLKSVRLSLGWSQLALAEHIGVSRQTVMRTEQGLYERPPVGLLTSLAPYVGGSLENGVKVLETRYSDWVSAKRRSSDLNLRMTANLGQSLHPLVTIRNRNKLSQIGLCKALCLNPGPIHKYELGQQSMPYQLEAALLEAGHSPAVVLQLKNAVEIWRARVHA
jgi:DNA-binding XRE family transcriptional regulator